MKKVAIIIPVFNIERYIAECLDSVINQSIGLEHLQVIVVNDGSTDQSLNIVEKYQQQYPDVFLVKSQLNQGLSGARNTGMDYIDAEFTMFLDGDDLLEKTACERLVKCAQTNQCDMVIGKMENFPEKGVFEFGYRFKSSSWIDLTKKNIEIPLSAGGKFYRSTYLEDMRFNAALKIQEDVEFNLKFLLKYKLVYFLHEIVYLYRQRPEQNSLFNNVYIKPANYINFANDCVLSIINKLNRYETQPAINQLVVNHLLRPLLGYIKHADAVLPKTESQCFFAVVQSALRLIPIENIQCSLLSIEQKLALFSIREQGHIGTGSPFPLDFNHLGELSVEIKGRQLSLGEPRKTISIDSILIEDGSLNVEGHYSIEGISGYSWSLFCFIGDNSYGDKQVDIEYCDSRAKCAENKPNHIFLIQIPLTDIDNGFHAISFELICKSNSNKILKLNSYSVSHLVFRQIKPFYVSGSEYLIRAHNNKIALQKKAVTVLFLAKLSRLVKTHIVLSKKLIEQKKWQLFWLRQLAILLKALNKNRKLILFRDRRLHADDNAEHLFIFFSNEKPKNVTAVFVLDPNSEDYARVKSIGKIVAMYGFCHRLYYLLATAYISSHCEWEAFEDPKECSFYFGDLISHKRIFLDHGIIFRDFSDSLNRYKQMIDLFIVKTKQEQLHILNKNYHYEKNQVRLLGMPRYDRLSNNRLTEKTILFMPTWRKELIPQWKPGERFEKIQDFKSTNYYSHISQFLNNQLLDQMLSDLNYKLIYYLHPGIEIYKNEFKINSEAVRLNLTGSLQHLIMSSRLLITDYSSIAFDFAYMKKPLIYYQFDETHFWDPHREKSYFDFRKDGFGEVVNQEAELIKQIKAHLDSGCALEQKYLSRSKNTFSFHDANNCRRIFDATMEILDS